MKHIFLIILGFSTFIFADFIRDENNGIVTDSKTKLQWQDNVMGTTPTWEEAIIYCEELTIDGNGWRLPNINELKTLIDDNKAHPAASDIFTQLDYTNNMYSSSTSCKDIESAVWVVDFNYGTLYYGKDKSRWQSFMCVRDEQ